MSLWQSSYAMEVRPSFSPQRTCGRTWNARIGVGVPVEDQRVTSYELLLSENSQIFHDIFSDNELTFTAYLKAIGWKDIHICTLETNC